MRRIGMYLCLILCLAVLLTSCVSNRYDEDNIDKLYKREWIIGKTQGEIIRRYGEFKRIYEREGGFCGAYYVNYDNWGIDPSYIHDTYYIVFDENGVAIDAYFARTSIGG